jgi:hypothetical protein
VTNQDDSQLRIVPPPRDDEAAAIVAALEAYLAGQRHAPARPRTPAWALAGRLASQGLAYQRRGQAIANWRAAMFGDRG